MYQIIKVSGFRVYLLEFLKVKEEIRRQNYRNVRRKIWCNIDGFEGRGGLFKVKGYGQFLEVIEVKEIDYF